MSVILSPMSKLKHPLEFELELVKLTSQLDELQIAIAAGDSSKQDEFTKLESKIKKVRKDTYGKLTAYQRVQLSRHFDRPTTLAYIEHMVEDFIEFHGDRLFRDDPAIIGGTCKLGEQRIMLIGHERGQGTQGRLKRNFGMSNPEGYRKALRLFRLAEKFALPIITLIDTQGAFPGLEAEERGQAEAIARNLSELSEITVPVISVVIGEGGSGGALALGVADRIVMLENACYSVITPEGCASILWHHERDGAPQEKAAVAAEILQLTASDLKRNGIADIVVSEPEGGAHWNHQEAAEMLSSSLQSQLDELKILTVEELVNARYDKYRKFGSFSEAA